MPGNFHEDTSYKYRWNQKELLGKILSGTLDEDLYISNLRIMKNPQSDWKYNPIFRGRCFSGKHKLRIDAELGDFTVPQDIFGSLFSYIANVTELTFSIKYTGHLSRINQSFTALCRYAYDLETVDVRCLDKIRIASVHTGFMDAPKLKTVILRCHDQMHLGGDYFINGIVDTVVLDSPEVASIPAATQLTRASAFAQDGTGGTIYIPKVLYDHLGDGTEYDYKAATNWSVLDSYGTVTWAQIEGSEYEL